MGSPAATKSALDIGELETRFSNSSNPSDHTDWNALLMKRLDSESDDRPARPGLLR